MKDIMKTVQSREDSNTLLKGITKAIENETKKKTKAGFLGMLLGTLWASLLGNTLAGKGMLRVGYRNKKEKEIIRVGYGNRNF